MFLLYNKTCKYYFSNVFEPGLWCALREDKPDRNLIEKLVKSWCRLQTVKKGEVVYLKDVVAKDINKISIFRVGPEGLFVCDICCNGALLLKNNMR